jgi:O-antigen ligase
MLIIGIVTLLLMEKENINLLKWPECIFLGFFFVTMVSWMVNPVYFDKIPIGVFSLLAFLLFLLITYWFRTIVNWSWQELEKIYLLFWLGGLYVAFVVILQQFDWSCVKDSWLRMIMDFYHNHRFQSERSIRSVGTTGNSNTTAAMLICFCLLSIYASSVLLKRWQKTAALSFFLVFIYALASTGSRGACIGLLGGLIVQLWMTGRRKWTVAITCILATTILLQPKIIPRNDTFGSTASARFKVWATSLDIFKENWLVGVLPLHFGQIYVKKTGVYLYHAHNVFLGIATEFGVIGLLLFCALLFTTIRRARKWRKVAKQKEEKRLAGVLLAIVMALLGHGLYDYPILSPQIGIIFLLSVMFIHIQYERNFLKCGGREIET